MPDIVPIALRLPAELDERVRARAEERGIYRHQALVDAITAGLDPGDIEAALEVVLRTLEDRDQHELALAVAVATDPRTDEERAANVAALRKMSRRLSG